MVNGSSDKEYGHPSTSELPGNKLRHNFLLGDMTWVKHDGTSWWPAQVIDEACVGSKPKRKGKYDCLVRLYGTCQHLYVDPWKSNTEFKMMLNQEGKSATEVFHEVLEKELSHVNLPDDEEESDNSEGTQIKVTTQKTSTVQNGKRRRGKKSSSSHDTVQAVDKDSCDNSAESLRRKRQKQVAHAGDKEGCKKGASVVRREGLRQSARSSASEDATEDSMVAETLAPHTEIKAMVRDILFKEIIDREHDAEMAYVDDVINGICSSAVDSMTGGTGLQVESNNVSQREREEKSDQATDDTTQLTGPETGNHATTNISSKKDNTNPSNEVIDTTPSRDAVMKEKESSSTRHIRQLRIMQSLGLMAPSGSPFGKNVAVAAVRNNMD